MPLIQQYDLKKVKCCHCFNFLMVTMSSLCSPCRGSNGTTWKKWDVVIALAFWWPQCRLYVARAVDPTVRPEKSECRHCLSFLMATMSSLCSPYRGSNSTTCKKWDVVIALALWWPQCRLYVARAVDPTVRPAKSEMSLLLRIRNRIRIGSEFNQISGSGSGLGIRIRIQAGENDPPKS